MSTRHLQKMIFVGCRELGLDADARRDLQMRVTGKPSLSRMSAAELSLVVGELKKSGFRPKGGKRHTAAPRADLRLIHVLWGKLRAAGKPERPDRAGLNAFIRARFEKAWGAVPLDVDALRDARQIEAVIRALTDWCRREGIATEKAK